MKATGIVRRIDDLGRVVIPKEIRRTLRLREGTPLEIFTDREGEIILKKYSPMVAVSYTHLDLSIGSMFGLGGVAAGLMVSTSVAGMGFPAPVGFLAGIGIGLLFGLFNGVVVAKGHIPAFIVTMGTQSIARGLALVLAHGMPIGGFPDTFNYLGTASLFGVVPFTVIIFIIVVFVMNFVMKKRPIGRYIYAVGGNEDAAKAAGINVDKIKSQAYLIEGALLGLASTLMAARLKSASPNLGTGYELDAIAGCIIGGVSFTGGIGNVFDMVLGALIIGVINNGMDLMGVEAFYKQIVKGSIIIIAVLLRCV